MSNAKRQRFMDRRISLSDQNAIETIPERARLTRAKNALPHRFNSMIQARIVKPRVG